MATLTNTKWNLTVTVTAPAAFTILGENGSNFLKAVTQGLTWQGFDSTGTFRVIDPHCCNLAYTKAEVSVNTIYNTNNIDC